MSKLTVLDDLYQARARYMAAPSHASIDEGVPEGRVCALTACRLSASVERLKRLVPDEPQYRPPSGRQARPSLVMFNALNSTERVLELFTQAIEAEEHGISS